MRRRQGWSGSVVLGIAALAGALVLAACSSSSGVTAPTTVASLPADTTPETTAEETTAPPATDAVTTTEAPKGLQLDELPGRIAVNSFGCGDGFGSGGAAVCIFDPDGTDLVEVKVDADYLSYLNWTWDGSLLLFETSGVSYAVSPDGTGVAERDPLMAPMTSQSPDGKWSVFPRRGQVGFWLSPVGTTRADRKWQQVTFGADDCCDLPRWSSDAASLLYSVGVGDGVCGQLWSTEVAITKARPIVGPGTPNESSGVCALTDSGKWSPDGSMVLFIDEGLSFDLSVPMLVNADGSGLRPLVDDSKMPAGWYAMAAVWSPDGSAIAMTIVHDMGTALYMVSTDGSEVIEIPGLPPGVVVAESMVWAPGL